MRREKEMFLNGDQLQAFKKGPVILDRLQVGRIAQMQNMLDVPPAPHLDPVMPPSRCASSRTARPVFAMAIA